VRVLGRRFADTTENSGGFATLRVEIAPFLASVFDNFCFAFNLPSGQNIVWYANLFEYNRERF
jgi:hypothetical protein